MIRQMTGPIALLMSLPLISSPAQSQSLPAMPGASSIMKGGLPNLSSMGSGNAAGVLSYCMKNKLLSGPGATSTLNGLMEKPGVKSSSGYKAGQAGNIVTGKGQSFSLNQVQGQMKSKGCNMVMKQATNLL